MDHYLLVTLKPNHALSSVAHDRCAYSQATIRGMEGLIEKQNKQKISIQYQSQNQIFDLIWFDDATATTLNTTEQKIVKMVRWLKIIPKIKTAIPEKF